MHPEVSSLSTVGLSVVRACEHREWGGDVCQDEEGEQPPPTVSGARDVTVASQCGAAMRPRRGLGGGGGMSSGGDGDVSAGGVGVVDEHGAAEVDHAVVVGT